MINSHSKKINLGCGPVYIDSSDWINLDFLSSPGVRQANLLGPLPVDTGVAKSVYSSHFLEHVPKSEVDALLRECFRVLQPGGVIRLVLPDLEEMARTYLALRDAGQHTHANFLVLELIDQCVRRELGGELGKLYQHLLETVDHQNDMIDFIRERTGVDLLVKSNNHDKRVRKSMLGSAIRGLPHRLRRLWIQIWLTALPSAFRMQNVSLADIGECHYWVWDFYQLQQALEAVGFISVNRRAADSSAITDFPFYPLDLDSDGRPRKGKESMYVEAIKP